MVDLNINQQQWDNFPLSTTMTQYQEKSPDPRSGARAAEQREDKSGSTLGAQQDDSDWEDEEDPFWPGETRTTSPNGSTSAYSRPSTRKRRRPPFQTKGSKKHVPSFSGSLTSKSGRVKEEEESQPLITQEDLMKGARQSGSFIARYSLGILDRSLKLMVIPFSIIVALVMFTTLLSLAWPSIQTVLAPICVLPGSSRLSVCAYGTAPTPKLQPKLADYPRLVETETKAFDQLMNGVIGGGALTLEVKHAEMATQDLVSLIGISELRAKDILASLLNDFIFDAKKAGRGLQKLSSKIGGAVDK